MLNLLQQNYLNVQGSSESSLLQSLSVPSPQDRLNRELCFEPVAPAAYTSQQSEQSLLPPGYPVSTSSSDVPFHDIAPKLPNTLTRIPPPSLTLQPPTSPPCIQTFDDDFQPLSSPSDILSHYGFSSNLSSPGIGSHFSHSPWSLSPQPPPTLHAPVSPHLSLIHI